jgi:3-oxoacyl-[acyl-carrier-protein] synthase III
MQKRIYTIITGTGSYVPSKIIKNEYFLKNDFYDQKGEKIDITNEEIISKFEAITEIKERRYVEDDLTSSDIGSIAAEKAIINAGIDKETHDYIIVGHDLGDVRSDISHIDIIPSLASRIKEKLGINNPKTVAYDIIFGCPGWLQGVIQADYFIRSGDAKRILVIGAETLSKMCDPHDRDSMIYADGAGATILQGVESSIPVGILSHSTRTDSAGQVYNLWLGKSYNADITGKEIFLKMNGRKLYNYALSTVPQVVKECLEKASITLEDVKKVLIHQANAKMDDAILNRIFRLYNKTSIPDDIMPMTISWLGNSSTATVPTLLDFILTGKMPGHELKKGQIAIFASVGAGMNINCIVYKLPSE